MIAVVDSGGANLASVMFALERLGKPATFTADPDIITRASHVILPGVGAAAAAMGTLRKHGLIDVLQGLRQPVLGICLGMQLLFDWSAEGRVNLLGLLPGKIEHFAANNLPVPHMGWNMLESQTETPLLRDLPSPYVYFVHSYRAPLGDFTAARTIYGETFSSVVARDNVFGCQFHPERSGVTGAAILRNFIAL